METCFFPGCVRPTWSQERFCNHHGGLSGQSKPKRKELEAMSDEQRLKAWEFEYLMGFVHWRCPKNKHSPVFASRHQDRKSLIRFCLECSEESGKMIKRVMDTPRRR